MYKYKIRVTTRTMNRVNCTGTTECTDCTIQGVDGLREQGLHNVTVMEEDEDHPVQMIQLDFLKKWKEIKLVEKKANRNKRVQRALNTLHLEAKIAREQSEEENEEFKELVRDWQRSCKEEQIIRILVKRTKVNRLREYNSMVANEKVKTSDLGVQCGTPFKTVLSRRAIPRSRPDKWLYEPDSDEELEKGGKKERIMPWKAGEDMFWKGKTLSQCTGQELDEFFTAKEIWK